MFSISSGGSRSSSRYTKNGQKKHHEKYFVKFKDGVHFWATAARVNNGDQADVGGSCLVRYTDGKCYTAVILQTPSEYYITRKGQSDVKYIIEITLEVTFVVMQ